MAEVLALVEQQQSLPAVEVIEILAQNPELPIQVASKYIKKVLHQDSNEDRQLEDDVNQVKRKIASVLRESQDMKKPTKPHPKQKHRTSSGGMIEDQVQYSSAFVNMRCAHGWWDD